MKIRQEKSSRIAGNPEKTLIQGHIGSQPLYGVYGISLRSEFALALPGCPGEALTQIEVCAGSSAAFAEAVQGSALKSRSDWYHYANLADGSSYVRWEELGEFLVSSDGRRIICLKADQASIESFQVYLLGQALSFALVKIGFEPLHATAIAVGGEAVVLLGASGFGKSSLAACFLAEGDPLLTDDLLLLEHTCERFYVQPGPPRIKLFPGIARRFLAGTAAGVPMNAMTAKLIIPLDPRQSPRNPVPVTAIYVLAPPHENRTTRKIKIEVLSPREAFMAIVANTFNYLLVDPARLQRQVRETTSLIRSIPVKKLSYPRVLADLPLVREAILTDLDGSPASDGFA
jgi:hypothetical protein